VFLAPDFPRYHAVWRQVREIFARHTDLIERSDSFTDSRVCGTTYRRCRRQLDSRTIPVKTPLRVAENSFFDHLGKCVYHAGKWLNFFGAPWHDCPPRKTES